MTPTGWLYQPFESGARAAALVTTGAVLSILNVFVTLTQSLGSFGSFLARHSSWVPSVSAVNVVAPQPDRLE